jgi:hypothetical protein
MSGENKRSVSTLVATFSVTFTGENERPLLAARIKVDGQEMELPFVLLVGVGNSPLVVAGQMDDPVNRLQYAETLTKTGTDFTLGTIEELRAAFQKPQTEKEPAASLDTLGNQ